MGEKEDVQFVAVFFVLSENLPLNPLFGLMMDV
jgi:hypothetical protein